MFQNVHGILFVKVKVLSYHNGIANILNPGTSDHVNVSGKNKNQRTGILAFKIELFGCLTDFI